MKPTRTSTVGLRWPVPSPQLASPCILQFGEQGGVQRETRQRMIRDIARFVIKILLLTVIVFLIHRYILEQYPEKHLYISLYKIYGFHLISVSIVFTALRYFNKSSPNRVFQLFIMLTIAKMLAAIVLLAPIFMGRSEHSQLEIINFFIPYFLFLTVEIMGVNKFLQKSG